MKKLICFAPVLLAGANAAFRPQANNNLEEGIQVEMRNTTALTYDLGSLLKDQQLLSEVSKEAEKTAIHEIEESSSIFSSRNLTSKALKISKAITYNEIIEFVAQVEVNSDSTSLNAEVPVMYRVHPKHSIEVVMKNTTTLDYDLPAIIHNSTLIEDILKHEADHKPIFPGHGDEEVTIKGYKIVKANAYDNVIEFVIEIDVTIGKTNFKTNTNIIYQPTLLPIRQEGQLNIKDASVTTDGGFNRDYDYNLYTSNTTLINEMFKEHLPLAVKALQSEGKIPNERVVIKNARVARFYIFKDSISPEYDFNLITKSGKEYKVWFDDQYYIDTKFSKFRGAKLL